MDQDYCGSCGNGLGDLSDNLYKIRYCATCAAAQAAHAAKASPAKVVYAGASAEFVAAQNIEAGEIPASVERSWAYSADAVNRAARGED